ncbi:MULTISPECIES: DeoR/GlpR family DNA-binding transcription regulator [unclassified Sphingopyxis]|jgi:DeoR family ulaG and ulaABCDEF operon transcriptional repressor|uniref:DeoR/GlpR family DNA-binding transcription regulator n=2 Tax=Sphingopyxis TaxID=165697 RepID=UPI00285B920F|nr:MULTISPECIES: DeoR/GlpR family DNA-binding transcription regulator [unclassified Sphingopyxis]MDR7061089.1 DeoR family ulaG and ulaABCDEF operon transcriptional repressor [Sphingopyxis sp. BE235]MDR7181546.1 DeoR family ulaG and ulaABCDEF operon transcriptional repressor [Sphingopyxis sp. BE249]
MHAAEREKMILDSLGESGFVSFRDLESRVAASPATIRRDLDRLEEAGVITRVRGGAKRIGGGSASPTGSEDGLSGIPFHENIGRNRAAKEAIGRAAAGLCIPGEGVMIDGGSTTLQMCPHLDGLALQVLTNSLHIVSALLPQPTTRILVPSGQVFREQNIVLSAAGDDGMPRFHAPKLFMGAASMGPAGLMQADVILVAAERRLIERADEIIVLVDSSKFSGPSGNVVCSLDEIDVVVTDAGIEPHHVAMMEAAGIRVIIA